MGDTRWVYKGLEDTRETLYDNISSIISTITLKLHHYRVL